MRAPVKQLAILSAAVATWAGVLGCDDNLRNDKQVRSAIVEARAANANGEYADALQKLTEAAGNTGASPAASAQAKAVLGAAEMAEAQRLMQTVDVNNRDIARLVHEISLLGASIANSNLKMERYRGFEPTVARQDAKQKIEQVQGGGEDKSWIAAENASIPTLAVVKQIVSRLQGEIAKRQEELKQLQQKRVAAAAEADKHWEAAENAKGQQRVDLVKQAAAAAKQAADLATEIELVQAAIVPLERDLAVAQAQQAAAADAVESFKRQMESIDSGWEAIEQQVATQAQIAASVLGAANASAPVGDNGPAIANTINEKAAQLQQLVQSTIATFNEADQRLDNAITHYGAAAEAAASFAREAQQKREGFDRTSPYYKAFDELMLIINPAEYKLGQAEANQLRATVNTSHAISLIGQQRMMDTLQPILTDVKLELPQSLNPQALPAEVQRTMEKANGTYDEAANLYLEVSQAPQDTSAKIAAHIGRIFALYGQVMLARAAGNPQEAQQFLAEAMAARDTALEHKAVLPAMPVELIVIPTTQPATAPTTAPEAATPGLIAPESPAPETATPETPAPEAPAPDAPAPDAPAPEAPAPETPVESTTPPTQ
ncbi:MAG TPA: hypothetical protein VGR35_14185 [Tepidisphaeraceae bacterium]|nr:hypothetical protein [Tepidisphaeraceae bacterium]